MIIERKHPFTGKINTMDLPITQQQIDDWQGGELIQNVMPNLTPDQREFLITGLLKEDWALLFEEE